MRTARDVLGEVTLTGPRRGLGTKDQKRRGPPPWVGDDQGMLCECRFLFRALALFRVLDDFKDVYLPMRQCSVRPTPRAPSRRPSCVGRFRPSPPRSLPTSALLAPDSSFLPWSPLLDSLTPDLCLRPGLPLLKLYPPRIRVRPGLSSPPSLPAPGPSSPPRSLTSSDSPRPWPLTSALVSPLFRLFPPRAPCLHPGFSFSDSPRPRPLVSAPVSPHPSMSPRP